MILWRKQGRRVILSQRNTLERVTVNSGYRLWEFSVQWPHFLLNERVLTWEESDKRILYSTLQADLWVTKDNKKGDMSSLWCSQAGELFGWKPCTKTEKERRQWMTVAFWSMKQPYAHRAVKENPFSVLQGTCLAWGHSGLLYSPSPFLCLSPEVTGHGKERRERSSLRFTRAGKSSNWILSY